MLKKAILGIAIIIMLSVTIAYMIKPGSLISPESVLTGKSRNEKDVESQEQQKERKVYTDQGSVSASEVFDGEEKIPEENKVDMPESVVTQGLQYTVNSFRVTKEKGDFPIEPYMEWSKIQQVDENGNMVGAYSYGIINVTVQNVSDVSQRLSLMSIFLQIRDQTGKSKYTVSGMRTEVRTWTGLDSSKGKSAPTFYLEPGETYEGELAYTESDEMLGNSKLELVITPSGIYGYNVDTRCIRMH